MKKREYITNQFKRTFNKKYENYCITRIYHLLNRDDIQIITQQLFRKKENGEIALADLYFPQINLYVEINEPYHRNQTEADKKRSLEMKEYKALKDEKLKALGEVIFYPLERIDIDINADTSLDEINLQIDNAVRKIKTKIDDLGDEFIPWTGEYKKPEDYVKSGVINCKNNVRLSTIQEVSELFNKNYKGMQRCWFKTSSNSVYVWCPKLNIEGLDIKNERYQNEISVDGRFIYEEKLENPEFYLQERKEKHRITFPYYTDESGYRMYKFKGVFEFNRELSNKFKKAVWEKVSEEVDLRKYLQ